MDPTPAEPPPGCLVLLLRLSAGMTADVVTGRGEAVAFAAVRQLADELLETLVYTASAYSVGDIDVAVLGYAAEPGGALKLFSVLPGGDPKPRLVPLAQVCGMPAEARAAEGQPRKWALLPAPEGEAVPAEALEHVYQMVAVWLTGRYAARPPVVIHCTTADGLDDAYIRVARSLGLLTTANGPVRLLHHVFDAQGADGPLGACWEALHEVSAELPENAEAGKPARRAVAVNDWDINDQWAALFTFGPIEDGTAWVGSAGFDADRAMWTQKMGNAPDQWEDAYAVDAGGGAAAIGDGASSGIYCRTWADQLCRRFLTDRPDLRDTAAFGRWVSTLRTEWREAIDYAKLNWSKKAKVDQVGAAATLLGLEVGPPDENGGRAWRACAVGDASLFWVRNGKLLATFPVVAADQFGSAPLLVRSSPGFRSLSLAAAGRCEPGDRFVLATDAVAARLFKSTAGGPGPEWARFETIGEREWRKDLDSMRSANDMVNDDCTLVVLRVAGTSEPPFAPVPAGAEEEAALEPVAVPQEALPPAAPAHSEQPPAPEPTSAGTEIVEAPREPQDVETDGAPTAKPPAAEGQPPAAEGQPPAAEGQPPPPEPPPAAEDGASPEPVSFDADFAISGDVRDLFSDFSFDPPADGPEPPATTEGFPE